MYSTEPSLILTSSSHFFIVPSLFAFSIGAYIPGSLVFGTYLVSTAYHMTKPRFTWLLNLDIAFAHIAHCTMIWTTLQWLPYSLPIYGMFLSCALITYYYGKQYRCLAWDSNQKTATYWHAFMHGFLGLSAGFSVAMAGRGGKNILGFFYK